MAKIQSLEKLAIADFNKITISYCGNHKTLYICPLLFVEVAFSCVVWHFRKSVVVLLTNGKLPLNGTLFFYPEFILGAIKFISI
ncbi:hypothetical protein [uncultured Polaribacter sp.]|uniref:hypothetical protein n=1 Tax=uncultured Polaribacter sp. TaxID=174711 RepID=UPI0026180C8B|nr:hypothetical protein [uncultured Polaribacter sp.]